MALDSNTKLLHKISMCAAFFALAAWICLFVNALQTQLQIFLFQGIVFFHPVVRPVLMVSLLVLFVLHRKTLSSPLFKAWAYLAVYLFLHIVYFLFVRHYALNYEFRVYSDRYFLLLILPLLPSLSGLIEFDKIAKILTILFVPVALVGLLQHIFNATILPVDFNQCSGTAFLGHLFNPGLPWRASCLHLTVTIPSRYNWLDIMRIFSFCNEALSFGFVTVFMMVYYGVTMLRERGMGRALSGAACAFAMLLTYWTYVRAIYLLAGFGVLTLLTILYFKKTTSKVRYLPIAYMFVGLALVSSLVAITMRSASAKAALAADSERFQHIVVAIPDTIAGEEISSEQHSAGPAEWHSMFKYFDFKNIAPKIARQEQSGLEKSADIKGTIVSNAPATKATIVSNAPNIQVPILSSDSFIMRFSEWRVFTKLGFKNWESILFGTEYCSEDFYMLRNLCFDNIYCSLFLQIGIIGLLLVGFLYWQLWLFIYDQTNDCNPLKLAVISVFGTLPVVGFVIDQVHWYFIIGIYIFFLANVNSLESTTVQTDISDECRPIEGD